MTVANHELLVVSEPPDPRSFIRRKRTVKRPSGPASTKVEDGEKHKPGSWSSQTTASENYDYTKPFVPEIFLEDKEPKEPPSPPILRKKGAEMRGTIAPSRRQRQMMRQVSGLGLEDPVFGDKDTSLSKGHASFFFEDMDIHDVPEDMRDMISLASDRTDVVETEEGESIQNESKSSEKIPSAISLPSNALRSSTSTLMAPLGLDPRAAAASLASSKGKNGAVTSNGNVPKHLTLHDSAQQSVGSGLSYLQSSGSFRLKAPRHSKEERGKSTASSIVLEDKHLAAKVNAMLSMHESSSTSFGATSHKLDRMHDDSQPRSFRSNYTPPSLPVSAVKPIQESERFLPQSMDDIFPPQKKSNDLKKPSASSKKRSKAKTKSSKDSKCKNG